LLGTVIGIVAATLAIGAKLNTGAAAAVTGALPAVGQAMISTAAGFVIAITCDFFRYVNLRQSGAGQKTQED
jgi:biopolymer transport protein ExbB/TolQ